MEDKFRIKVLNSYVFGYLEEEIRAEALSRDLSTFSNFLELAAFESNSAPNMSKLSQEIGVSHTTIASYYQILEDCLIAERVEPLTKSSTRKKLTKTQKYILFDLGVRRVAAREGTQLPKDILGGIFEQFVGLELLRQSRFCTKPTRLRFWRDPDGPEVDWVLEKENLYIPLEVKWTDSPTTSDIKHLKTFLKEYPQSPEGYLICQTPRPLKLDKNITALPWPMIDTLLHSQ